MVPDALFFLNGLGDKKGRREAQERRGHADSLIWDERV